MSKHLPRPTTPDDPCPICGDDAGHCRATNGGRFRVCVSPPSEDYIDETGEETYGPGSQAGGWLFDMDLCGETSWCQPADVWKPTPKPAPPTPPEAPLPPPSRIRFFDALDDPCPHCGGLGGADCRTSDRAAACFGPKAAEGHSEAPGWRFREAFDELDSAGRPVLNLDTMQPLRGGVFLPPLPAPPVVLPAPPTAEELAAQRKVQEAGRRLAASQSAEARAEGARRTRAAAILTGMARSPDDAVVDALARHLADLETPSPLGGDGASQPVRTHRPNGQPLTPAELAFEQAVADAIRREDERTARLARLIPPPTPAELVARAEAEAAQGRARAAGLPVLKEIREAVEAAGKAKLPRATDCGVHRGAYRDRSAQVGFIGCRVCGRWSCPHCNCRTRGRLTLHSATVLLHDVPEIGYLEKDRVHPLTGATIQEDANLPFALGPVYVWTGDRECDPTIRQRITRAGRREGVGAPGSLRIDHADRVGMTVFSQVPIKDADPMSPAEAARLAAQLIERAPAPRRKGERTVKFRGRWKRLPKAKRFKEYPLAVTLEEARQELEDAGVRVKDFNLAGQMTDSNIEAGFSFNGEGVDPESFGRAWGFITSLAGVEFQSAPIPPRRLGWRSLPVLRAETTLADDLALLT